MYKELKLSRERFGRYLILDHLVDGGMAKICRARFLGEQADKVVAIKMVQPQFSQDEAFKTMFMDEIKLTFGLIHPNIVQVYDYGYHNKQLFVAMEYCDGRNLKEYLEKLKERKFVFPVEISVYIITQVCQALSYAHTFTDKLTGEERGIIHRDISPHNIMLTYDGNVKVIDFGIAKSKTNSEATQAGTIKGKLSYLAPEYLEGYELDPRYDQFAVGITLWEMLCSRKLFKDNNDLAVLKKIQECKVSPPSSINPNVPKELDDIVLKALSKNRSNRYENMDQLNRALMKFLYSKFPDFNATDLSYFAQELFKEDIKRDREKMYEFGKIDIKPYIEDMKKETTGHPVNESKAVENRNSDEMPTVARDENVLGPRQREQVFDMGFDEVDPLTKLSKTKKVVGRKIGEELSSTNAEVKDLKTVSVSKKSQPTIELIKKTSKKDGTQSVPLKKSKNEQTPKASPIGKAIAGLVVVAAVGAFLFLGGEEKSKVVKSSDGKTRVPASGAENTTTNSNSGIQSNLDSAMITVNILGFNKSKHRVFLDGVRTNPDLIGNISVPLNKEVILRVEVSGKKHFIQALNYSEKKSEKVEIPEDLPMISYAYVSTSKPCLKGIIKYEVFGENRVTKLPITDSFGIAFPVDFDQQGNAIETNHEVELYLAGESIARKFSIKLRREEESVDLCDLVN